MNGADMTPVIQEFVDELEISVTALLAKGQDAVAEAEEAGDDATTLLVLAIFFDLAKARDKGRQYGRH